MSELADPGILRLRAIGGRFNSNTGPGQRPMVKTVNLLVCRNPQEA